MNDNALYVGVDLSINSPGVAVETEGSVHLCGFQQRKTDVEIIDQPLNTLRVTRLDYPEGDRWFRCAYMAEHIVSWVKGFGAEKVHVFIEGYAFSMSGSSSVTKLAEVGGVLRYLIMKQGWTFSELPPNRIKKCFSGDGRAKKEAMIHAFQELHGLPLMNTVLNIQTHQHPQEDMIDALAVLRTGVHFQLNPEKQTKGVKRRRTTPKCT